MRFKIIKTPTIIRTPLDTMFGNFNNLFYNTCIHAFTIQVICTRTLIITHNSTHNMQGGILAHLIYYYQKSLKPI